MHRLPRLIHQSPYYVVELLADPRLLKVTRLPRTFESEEVVDAACEPVQAALDGADRRSHRMLYDSRAAIGRNDPAYEQWFAVHRRRMVLGFERVAILVQTPIGKLHADRLVAAEKLSMPRVFLDEKLAMQFLIEG